MVLHMSPVKKIKIYQEMRSTLEIQSNCPNLECIEIVINQYD